MRTHRWAEVKSEPTRRRGTDPCPECGEGRVYRQKEPKTLIRIVGQAPLKATVFERERLRCNACCQVFTAAEPVGVGAGKYDMTAVAMIALLKYGTGMPFNRMERLEEQLGMPLAAATQWELMEAAASWRKTLSRRREISQFGFTWICWTEWAIDIVDRKRILSHQRPEIEIGRSGRILGPVALPSCCGPVVGSVTASPFTPEMHDKTFASKEGLLKFRRPSRRPCSRLHGRPKADG